MSSPGTLSAALDFLPRWWQETSDPGEFHRLLSGCSQRCGWIAAGFAWPAELPSVESIVGSPDEAVRYADLVDAIRSFAPSENTRLVQTPNGRERACVAVCPPGKPAALLWAELSPGESWSDEARSYLAFLGKTLERSPALTALIGPLIDPERLAQRLSDAAIISGRMAHDFDNILTGIMGFADLTVPLLPHGSQQQSFVAEIAKVGQRGISFTQQLHQLSRSNQVRPSPGSVVAAVGREETRLKPAMHPALVVEKVLPFSLPAVAMDAGPLQLVLGHVLENAVDACPKGGTVRVAAEVVELSEADARGYLGKVAAGPHVQVTVADSGPGIAADVRSRLFVEPFFTTKVRHRGLGLAVCYRTLSSHRGGIRIEPLPPPASGTRVVVVLPLAPHRLPPVNDATPPPALNSGRSTVGLGSLKSTIVRG